MDVSHRADRLHDLCVSVRVTFSCQSLQTDAGAEIRACSMQSVMSHLLCFKKRDRNIFFSEPLALLMSVSIRLTGMRRFSNSFIFMGNMTDHCV